MKNILPAAGIVLLSACGPGRFSKPGNPLDAYSVPPAVAALGVPTAENGPDNDIARRLMQECGVIVESWAEVTYKCACTANHLSLPEPRESAAACVSDVMDKLARERADVPLTRGDRMCKIDNVGLFDGPILACASIHHTRIDQGGLECPSELSDFIDGNSKPTIRGFVETCR